MNDDLQADLSTKPETGKRMERGVTAVSHSSQSLSVLNESDGGKRKQEKKGRKKKNEWKAKIQEESYIDTEVKDRKKSQTPNSM